MALHFMRRAGKALVLSFLIGIVCLPSVGFSAGSNKSDLNFVKRTLIISGQHLTVEMAMTPAEQEHGLMYRQKLADNEGMLFVFAHEQPLNFWMKNTYIPLAIGFFDKNRKLIDIQEMAPTSEIETNPPIYQSRAPAMYALEVSKGWFKRHHVQTGAVFTLRKAAMNPKPVMRRHR